MDATTRFIDYLRSLPGVHVTYPYDKASNTSGAFRYICGDVTNYLERVPKHPLGAKQRWELPKLEASGPKRVVYPPKVFDAPRDPILLATPMVLYQRSPFCNAKYDYIDENKEGRGEKHRIVLVYNRARGEVEVWDDLLPKAAGLFGYAHLIERAMGQMVTPMYEAAGLPTYCPKII